MPLRRARFNEFDINSKTAIMEDIVGRSITNSYHKRLPKKYIKYGLLLIICIATTLALQAIRAPFFLDDTTELEHVSSFLSVKEVFSPDTFGFKRPIKNLIFWIVYHTDDHAVIIGHTISLALYIAAIFTVFFWFRLWTKNRIYPVIGAGIWALSPTLVSSIIWLSCANILVGTISSLAGLICWEYARRKQNSGKDRQSYLLWILSIMSFTLAFNAYEAVIIFPVLTVIQDLIIKQRKWSIKLLVPYLAIGIITIILLFMRGKPVIPYNSGIMGITHDLQLSFSSAFLILSHIKQWLWPFGRQEILGTFIWNKSASLWMLSSAWFALIILVAASFILLRRFPIIIAGFLWSIIALIPMCNVIPLHSGPFADYYLTLASIGLSLGITFAIKKLLESLQRQNITRTRKQIMQLVVITIIATRLIAVTSAFNWTKAWNNPALLLHRSIQSRQYAYHAQATLARIMLLNNELEYAEELAKQSLTETQDFVLPRNVLGDIARKQNRFQESQMWYEQVLEIDPNNMYTHLSLANLYNDHLNDKELAEQHFMIVINNKQNNQYRETAYINLSIILGTAKRYKQAITLLNKALLEFPESRALQNNLQVTKKRQLANKHKSL